MDTVSLSVSECVEFHSGKAACVERACLRRQVQSELYEATVVGHADLAAHADHCAILKEDFA